MHCQIFNIRIYMKYFLYEGRNSSVGIADRFGVDVRGSNPGGGRDFPHKSRPALGTTHPSMLWGNGSFPGVKRPGRGADRPPSIAPR